MNRLKLSGRLAIAASILLQPTGFAQDPGPGHAHEVMTAQGAHGLTGLTADPNTLRFVTQQFAFASTPVLNAPYSAEETTESVQTLADGTRIVNSTKSKTWRDSKGRTRSETTIPGGKEGETRTMISISDPVAGTSYSLDTGGKIAHKMAIPNILSIDGPITIAESDIKALVADHMRSLAEGSKGGDDLPRKAKDAVRGKAEAEARRLGGSDRHVTSTYTFRTEYHNDANTQRDDLGTMTIEGVPAQGSRETMTIATGAIGNDRPIVITSERWFSPELQVELKSVRSDPRTGTTTHSLTSISRQEPNQSMFTPPADYAVEGAKSMSVAYAERFKSAQDAFAKGNDDLARKHFEEFLKLRPGNEAALLGLSQLAIRRGDAEAALKLAQEVLHANPASKSGAIMAGSAFVRLGRTADAQQMLDQIRKTDPGQANALARAWKLTGPDFH